MSGFAHLNFDDLNGALKAAGEETRLRILVLLAEAELTVSDLTQILRPVAAAHFAASQAAGRSRAGRAISRGRLGVLPPGRRLRQRALARTLVGNSIPRIP
jgi:DNA-binding transcriptional ArsR family regulator